MVRQTVLRVAMLASLAVAALATTSGCGSHDPAPAGSSAPTTIAVDTAATVTAGASTSAGASAQDGDRIGPTGIGALVVGAPLAQLQTAGAIGSVQAVPQCPDWSTAEGTGDLAFVHAAFSHGSLAWISATTTQVSTVDGAQLGMALDEVSGIYGGRGVELTNAAGEKALGVAGNGGSGLLLRTSGDLQVNVIEAGTYELLQRRFTEGKGC